MSRKLKAWDQSRFTVGILKKGQNHTKATEVTIIHGERGIEIALPEHGEYSAAPGHGSPIYLEHYEGKFWLRVWADINQEEATHNIDLSGALELNRMQED